MNTIPLCIEPSIATRISRNLPHRSIHTSVSRSNSQEKEISSGPALREAASERAVSRRHDHCPTIQERLHDSIPREGSFTNGLLSGMVTVIVGLKDKELGKTGRRILLRSRASTDITRRTPCSGMR